jgi:hypothetical protein
MYIIQSDAIPFSLLLIFYIEEAEWKCNRRTYLVSRSDTSATRYSVLRLCILTHARGSDDVL